MLHKERNKLSNNDFTRKNPRLTDYDYSVGGYYFITICTKDKIHYFGEIAKEEMQLNDIGKLAQSSIEKIEKIYKTIKVDKFVVGESIWQKSYYDHIIRNEKDYLRIWQYIDENILKWSLDKYYN